MEQAHIVSGVCDINTITYTESNNDVTKGIIMTPVTGLPAYGALKYAEFTATKVDGDNVTHGNLGACKVYFFDDEEAMLRFANSASSGLPADTIHDQLESGDLEYTYRDSSLKDSDLDSTKMNPAFHLILMNNIATPPTYPENMIVAVTDHLDAGKPYRLDRRSAINSNRTRYDMFMLIITNATTDMTHLFYRLYIE